MKNGNFISTVVALALAVAFILPPVSVNAGSRKRVDRYDWNRAQIQREVSKSLNERMERIHYYNTRGRKYREDRVYIDLNTGRRRWEHDVPRSRW